jgi:5'-nucleotidase
VAASCALAQTVTVKVIGMNDFHGNLFSPGSFSIQPGGPGTPLTSKPAGGADYLAGYIASLKAQNPRHVVVHAGDMIGATPLVSAIFHDEPTIEVMNEIGIDFNATGNHEYDEGKDELLRMQNGGCHPTDLNSCQGAAVGTPVPFDGADFKMLAANVVVTATGKTLFVPYGIKSFATPQGPLRIGFIGMTLKETPTIVTPTGVAGLTFNDEAATVNSLVSKLRARGVETIVVVVHQGGFQGASTSPSGQPPNNYINDCKDNLAGTSIVPIVAGLDDEVDLVVSGHTHTAYNCRLPNAVGRSIPVTQASAFGRVLSDIDLTIDMTTRDVVGATVNNIVVDRTNAAITPNATVALLANAYNTLVSPIANQVIGSIAVDLPNTNADVACNMLAGDLVADAQLAATAPNGFGNARIAFMNRGGVRNPGLIFNQISGGEAPGDVTYGEAFTMQPFGNSLVTMTLTAQQIKDVLEEQFAGCGGQPADRTRIMLPSKGFKYVWDGAQSCGSRISNVTLTDSNGTETLVDGAGLVVNPAATYRVTVNNFMATGGDGYLTFLGGTDLLGGAQDIDALVAYMADYKAPNPPYAPGVEAEDGGTPRIGRVVGGSACPGGSNTNP